MIQKYHMLLVIEGEDYKASHIVLWSLKEFQVLQQIENADIKSIDKVCPLSGSQWEFFVTAGKSSVIKVWRLDLKAKEGFEPIEEVDEIFLPKMQHNSSDLPDADQDGADEEEKPLVEKDVYVQDLVCCA